MCACVCARASAFACACVCMHACAWMQCPGRPESGVRSPGTELTGSCESHNIGAGSWTKYGDTGGAGNPVESWGPGVLRGFWNRACSVTHISSSWKRESSYWVLWAEHHWLHPCPCRVLPINPCVLTALFWSDTISAVYLVYLVPSFYISQGWEYEQSSNCDGEKESSKSSVAKTAFFTSAGEALLCNCPRKAHIFHGLMLLN